MNSTAETAWETRRNCNVTIGVDPFRATFQKKLIVVFQSSVHILEPY